jgi:hypothetical protein
MGCWANRPSEQRARWGMGCWPTGLVYLRWGQYGSCGCRGKHKASGSGGIRRLKNLSGAMAHVAPGPPLARTHPIETARTLVTTSSALGFSGAMTRKLVPNNLRAEKRKSKKPHENQLQTRLGHSSSPTFLCRWVGSM